MKKTVGMISTALLVLLGAAACGGGGATVKSDATTTGQQLMDLKKAFDAGVITEKEYEKQREKILKGG
ncbi:MAG: SHOCT domain-containing protein [Gammaproteobacteria bacterium]|nr:SHOCT domain-containing protein [Gammaproteobacteria bacterium]